MSTQKCELLFLKRLYECDDYWRKGETHISVFSGYSYLYSHILHPLAKRGKER